MRAAAFESRGFALISYAIRPRYYMLGCKKKSLMNSIDEINVRACSGAFYADGRSVGRPDFPDIHHSLTKHLHPFASVSATESVSMKVANVSGTARSNQTQEGMCFPGVSSGKVAVSAP